MIFWRNSPWKWFSVLNQVFSIAHTPWMRGYVCFICASREFHSFLVHSHCLSSKNTDSVVPTEQYLKTVYVYVYIKLSYTTSCDFMHALSYADDPFHQIPHPQRAAVRPWRAQSAPRSPSLQQFQYSYPTNNPDISHKLLLEVFSQCYHIVV